MWDIDPNLYVKIHPLLIICSIFIFTYSIYNDQLDLYVQIYTLLMIYLILLIRYILYWWFVWFLCSDISYIDDLFDLYVQIYPALMICLIFMFRYILHWWSLCSDISSIDDLFDLYCLGDKYELPGSRNLIKEVVSSFKINQENWIRILKGIKKHENTFLFEDLCDILRVKVQGIRVYSF